MRRYLTPLAASAVLCAAAVAWADPLPSTTYEGRSSQKKPVSVRTSADGLELRRFRITRVFDCGAGSEPVTGTFRQTGGAIRVNARGRFRGRGRVEGVRGGQIRSGKFRFRGRFGRRGRVAVGVYRERVELRNGTECGTGRVTFRVRAR